MKLSGKVAIVTGGGRGLGKLYCIRMAEQGANIVVADIIDVNDTIQEINAQGGTAIGLKVDVSSEQDTLRMAEETVSRFGRIDILINNAAIFYGIVLKPFYEIAPEEWDRIMAVNVKGPWLCAKAVFPQMKKQGNGKIINIASDVFWGGTPFFLHYLASKAAVIGLTRGLAAEVGGCGICVNAVAPGLTMTKAGKSMVPEERAALSAQRRCLKRLEQPEDIVGTIIFLASDDSDFITGQAIVVNGGGNFH